MSVRVVLRSHGLERGVLVRIDDTAKKRAKVTSRLAHVHKLSVKASFARDTGVEQILAIRGGPPVKALIRSARVWVQAQGQKQFVIALKYEGET